MTNHFNNNAFIYFHWHKLQFLLAQSEEIEKVLRWLDGLRGNSRKEITKFPS